MNIMSTQYTLMYKSFDIYLSGCKGDNGVHCASCHNPESWSFDMGDLYNEEYFKNIKNKINDFDNMINNIMIFGGEPLDQNHDDLIKLLNDLKTLNKPIWIFTRYSLDLIPQDIKNLCDYIKCGRYIPELTCKGNVFYGLELATSNQKIYKKGLDY